MTDITRAQAEGLVDDLIQAFHEYETVFPNRKSYREHYYAEKERMITALLIGRVPGIASAST